MGCPPLLDHFSAPCTCRLSQCGCRRRLLGGALTAIIAASCQTPAQPARADASTGWDAAAPRDGDPTTGIDASSTHGPSVELTRWPFYLAESGGDVEFVLKLRNPPGSATWQVDRIDVGYYPGDLRPLGLTRGWCLRALPEPLPAGDQLGCAFIRAVTGPAGLQVETSALVSLRNPANEEIVITAGPLSTGVYDPGLVTNPDLVPGCGIDIVLALDASASITIANATADVKSGVHHFLGRLNETGSRVAIVEFGDSARVVVPLTEVTAQSLGTTFGPYIDGSYDPKETTNWEAGLRAAAEIAALPGAEVAAVVVFTDGNPTRSSAGDNPTTAMRLAEKAADQIRLFGAHVLAIGVGFVTAENLIAISGPDPFVDSSAGLVGQDFSLIPSSPDLPDALGMAAEALCVVVE